MQERKKQDKRCEKAGLERLRPNPKKCGGGTKELYTGLGTNGLDRVVFNKPKDRKEKQVKRRKAPCRTLLQEPRQRRLYIAVRKGSGIP